VWVTHINIQLWKETLSADFYTCDIKWISQVFQWFKSSDMLEVSKILATQKGLWYLRAENRGERSSLEKEPFRNWKL
jgi:hypothetical protein